MFRRLPHAIALFLFAWTMSGHAPAGRITSPHSRDAAANSAQLLPGNSRTAGELRDAPAFAPRATADLQARNMLARTPLTFEKNLGQAAPDVLYLARGGQYGVTLRQDRMTLRLHGGSETIAPAERAVSEVSIKLLGGKTPARVEGLDVQEGRTHYFKGSDPSRWVRDVPHAGRVRYEAVYPGIDMVFYGSQRRVEFDFIVAPGADARAIGLGLEGVEDVRLDDAGDLVLGTANGEVIQRAPIAYQERDGERHHVEARYMVAVNEELAEAQVRLRLGEYDRTLPLVIDPVFDYSTYLGAEGQDNITALAIGANGDVHVTGYTTSLAGFPTNGGGSHGPRGDIDVFVTRFNSSGQFLMSTVFGGGVADEARSISLDSQGNAYVAGVTYGEIYATPNTRFPTTVGAYQTVWNGGADAFATKIAPSGGLVYSTFIGASLDDFGTAGAVTAAGEFVVAGETNSTNFPRTMGPTHAGQIDMFVLRLNTTGTGLISRLVGGNLNDHVEDVVVNSIGIITVAGETRSANFPMPNDFVHDASFNGVEDVVIAKFDPGLNLFVSTFLGGSNEEKTRGIALYFYPDPGEEDVLVTGYTMSADFPGGPWAVAGQDVFIARLSQNLSLLGGTTVIGGSGTDVGHAIALDTLGHVYVVGDTNSPNFPVTTGALDNTLGGSSDAFVLKTSYLCCGLFYSSYLGGSTPDFARAIGVIGNATVWVGGTTNGGFPIAGTSSDPTHASGADAYLVRFSSFLDHQVIPLTVNRVGQGRVTGFGIDCGSFCNSGYEYGDLVTLTAEPALGWEFTGWTNCTSSFGLTCNVHMIDPTAVTATFAPAHLLTLVKSGTGAGTVTSNLSNFTCDPSCGSATRYVSQGTLVTLTATPSAGSQFSSWSGCDSVNGPSCSITMHANRSVTTSFTLAPAPVITSLTPATGSTQGGTAVTITGHNLLNASVTIGGAAARNLTVVNNTMLTFLTPPTSAAGTATVAVTTPNGQTSGLFNYVAPQQQILTEAQRPVFSFDGQWMAYESASALVTNDTNGLPDVFVRNRSTGAVVRVSISSSGAQAIGGGSGRPSISATGRFIAFESAATNLVPEDTNRARDIFVHDRDPDANGAFDETAAGRTPRTFRVNLGPPTIDMPGGDEALGGDSHAPSISGGGRWIAFESAATNLVLDDTNQRRDVFVHDTQAGRTVRSSVSSSSEQANGDSSDPDISLDGQVVGFQSAATNLVANDTNNQIDVFIRDRDTDLDAVYDEAVGTTTYRVSVATGGAQAVGGPSTEPSLTSNGMLIAFTSEAANLVAGDTNQVSDVFLHDRANGTTRRMSLDPVTGRQFVGASYAPAISANGNTLIFSIANVATIVPGNVAFDTAGGQTGGTVTIPGPNQGGGPEDGAVAPGQPGATPGESGVSGDGSTTGSPNEQPGGGTAIDVVDTGNEQSGGGDDPPFIGEIQPPAGPSNDNDVTVDIIGGNFEPGTTVEWNGQVLNPTFVDDGHLVVDVPAGNTGQVEVEVRSNGETSNSLRFTYRTAVSTPLITNVDPRNGLTDGTTPVKITGTGFVPAGISVRFRGRFAQILSASETEINVLAPYHVEGQAPIIVSNADGGEVFASQPFVYTPSSINTPVITSLSPIQGFREVTTVVTVRGAQHSFAPGTTATLGGLAVPVSYFSDRLIVIEAPPSPTAGDVPLVVTVPNAGSAQTSFTYEARRPPFEPSPDADGDGMTDAFEDAFGLNPNDPMDAGADPDGDGRSSLQEATDRTHPVGMYTRYLAEGAINGFFNARVAIANPNTTAATVLIHFQRDDPPAGEPAQVLRYVVVPPLSRFHIDPERPPLVPPGSFATVVESDSEVVVDRSMFWDDANYGSHAETSLAAPATTWYLAEGATNALFELFYLLQNPDLTRTADVRVRYLRSFGDPIELTYQLAPQSRKTIRVNGEHPDLANADISSVVTSENGVPIIVERAMYAKFDGQRPFEAGHDSAGVTAPSTSWFLAEGATGPFFDMFVLYANPTDSDAIVETTYLLPDGTTIANTRTVGANRRVTVPVADEDPRLRSATPSTRIVSTNGVPIVVERAMWWPSGGPWIEGHNSPGSTATGTRWAVADGETGPPPVNTATFLLIANTSNVPGKARVTLLFEDGSPALSKDFDLLPQSRQTIGVGAEFPTVGVKGYGALIESIPASAETSAAQIVVERAMYSDTPGQFWGAGTNALATRLR